PCRRERGPDHRTTTFVVYRVRSAGHEGRSPSGGGTPLPGATSPAETGEIRARGEARRSEADQSILQRLVRFGDVNVANKLCATSRCRKAIIPEINGKIRRHSQRAPSSTSGSRQSISGASRARPSAAASGRAGG